MTARKKKKAVHWTKLPRAKLVGTVKRLELANAKLKTQLAELRETKLLNERTEPMKRFNDPTVAGDGLSAVEHAIALNRLLVFPWEGK